MAIFKYKLQNILNVREKQEETAKMEYAQAQMALNEEEALLQSIIDSKNAYIEEGVRLRMGEIDPVKMKENENFVKALQEKEEKQRVQVEVARKAVDAAMYKLSQARMQTKTYEKLKADAFEDFVKEENAKENKEIDELNSYRFSTKT